MIRDVAGPIRAMDGGETPRLLLFWGHQRRGDGLGPECLSQWWPAPFSVDGVVYPTAEHWMMAGKARLFGDDVRLAEILASGSPGAAKAAGRRVVPYDDARWAAHRFDVVVEGSVAKFASDPALRAFLLGTGDRVLVEASPRDRVWGIGLGASHPAAADPRRWRGQNLLGFALMAARDRLRDPTGHRA